MKLILALALVALVSGRPDDTFLAKVDSALLGKSKETTFNVFVTFKAGTEDVLKAIDETRFETDTDKRIVLRMALNQRAHDSQLDCMDYLDSIRKSYTSYWITNQLYVRAVNVDDIVNLAKMDEVSMVEEEVIVNLDDPLPDSEIIYGRDDQEEWGVKIIQAAEARALLNNATSNAAPVRISTIDTGVRYTHEALKDNFLGTHGWFDPYDKTPTPIDNNGHGTHTTGTIAGKGGIGVYPDAKWLACRGCATSSCSQFALLACAEYIVCPTLPDGTSPDCSKTPHLVSNSWGGGRGNTWYDGAIAAFHTAGVIPLFSQGNSGPSCGSANSPGDRDVIGVGSTTVDDEISSFSSIGPTINDKRMKPEISAPGSNVLSSYHTSDDAYRALSGTSMACPHAAGLVAILKALKGELTYADVMNFSKLGAETDLKSSGRVCEGIPDNVFPNHVFGHGRINCFKSLKSLIDANKH